MATAWEKEKARDAKHAEALRAEMEAAIRDVDKARFQAAYIKALRYMPARGEGNRRDLFRRFIAAEIIATEFAKEGRFED